MAKRIVIVSGFPIPQNPRVVKEADVLSDAGFDVHVLSSFYNHRQIVETNRRMRGSRWTHHAICNAVGSFSERLRWQQRRIVRSLARKLNLGTSNSRFTLEVYQDLPKLIQLAFRLKGDFYSLHCEPSLFLAQELTRRRIPYSVDIEDWYSEERVYGIDRGPYEVLRDKEFFALRNCRFSTTTSKVMSLAIAKRYQVIEPTVIHNSFPDSDFELSERVSGDSGKVRIAWFSQTIGPDRGLEMLIDASARNADRIELLIRGRVSDEYQELLNRRAEGQGVTLRILGLCEHHELMNWLSENDVGYAGELPLCGNKNLTISNKILQYLQAGLAVVATDTEGQKEVARCAPSSIHVFHHRSLGELTSLLTDLVANRDRIRLAKADARRSFERFFSWTQSAKALKDLFFRELGASIST